MDKEYKMGFVSNPKVCYQDLIQLKYLLILCFLIMIEILYFLQRFNVAVTRAKALLIVIGNPELLCRDRNWKK